MTTRIAWILLLAAAAVRLAYLDVPPLDFHATRQYRSALIARAQSDTALAALTPPQRAAATQAGKMRLLEPPIVESVARATWAIAGREDLRLPRLLSVFAWLLGCWAVWRILRNEWPMAALVAMGLVAFTPYSIDASRAFMPDPLMVGLMTAALAAIVANHRASSPATRLTRVLLTAAALVVKPMAGLLIAPVMLGLDVQRRGWRGTISAGLSILVAALPVAAYYAWLLQSGSSIGDNRFFPELWGRSSFWLGWLAMIARVVGLPLFFLAVMLSVATRGTWRILVAALWGGYLLLGLGFSHHISTHDYYSLPLIPVVALAIGAGLTSLRPHVSARTHRSVSVGTVVIALVSWAMTPTAAAPWGDPTRALTRARAYADLGSRTGHSLRVITLDGDYGYPIAYHGLVGTSQLPLSIDRSLAALSGGTVPPLADTFRARRGEFFLATVQAELDAAPDLAPWLDQRAVRLGRDGTDTAWAWTLYDLRVAAPRPVPVPDPADVSVPFGWMDTPGDPITLGADSVLLQGWALDDRGLDRVDVFAVTPSGDVRLGQATRAGRREDLAAIHPTAPDIDRSGWAFSLVPIDRDTRLTGLRVVAVDATGRTAEIGRRQVVVVR
jgi:hypothetical protein